MTLAAASMITMLLPSMRLGADGTPASTSTVKVCVAPFATILAEGDTGMAGGRAYEACPTKDVDGLVVQGLRAGPCLGVPDVEVHRHRGGRRCLRLDDPGTGCRFIVRLKGRTHKSCVDVGVVREVASDAVFGRTMYHQIRGGLRETDPQIAGPVWKDLGDPTSRGIQVTLVWNIRGSKTPTPIGLTA